MRIFQRNFLIYLNTYSKVGFWDSTTLEYEDEEERFLCWNDEEHRPSVQ